MAMKEEWVRVDAYCVSSSEEKSYRADREELATRSLKVFGKYFHSTERCWAGSEDGEAVVGLNEKGELRALIHLDPMGIDLLKQNPSEIEFEKALLDYNGMSFEE